MCSIGHHDGPDAPVRRPRRHTDGSVTRAVAGTPRKVLTTRLAETTAQLRAELETGEADALAAQHRVHGAQLELVPPDMAQLPASSFRTRGVPSPDELWYSSAREA